MPRVSAKTIENDDGHDTLAELVGLDDTIENSLASSMVKMKLSRICNNRQIVHRLNHIVLEMNRLMGEAYLFANFHLMRLMEQVDTAFDLPSLDRCFYYRCILAVSENKCHASTLGDDFEASKAAFDALRPLGTSTINIEAFNQIVADLSIVMATMAKNHVWTNLERRILRYLSWAHRPLKRFHKRIALSVSTPLLDLTGWNNEQATNLAMELRALVPIPNKRHTSGNARLTMPLFKYLLDQTREGQAKAVANKKKFIGRMFTLLPLKSHFTISHIPISSMMLMRILRDLKLEKFTNDGRDQNHSLLWRKYFNINLVETVRRRFDNRIVTDGCAVSVLMEKKTLVVASTASPSIEELKILKAEKDLCRIIAVDPGFTDIVTWAERNGKTGSFSSARYYEIAKYNMSGRRTNKWNAETQTVVTSIPTIDFTTTETLGQHITAYISCLPILLEHRATRGYRNMRFLRYVSKKKAINVICNQLAPKGIDTIIGFGDWNGGNGTPISRRCAGPLQEIKMELGGRSNVRMLSVSEKYTSCKCHTCHNRLTNMKAITTKVKQKNVFQESSRKQEMSKIHKVLHCRNSVGDTSCCGATWNRDINAAKNILMLTMFLLHGFKRPDAFCAPPKTKSK